MSRFKPDPEAALREAFDRTAPHDGFERAWAFERQRRALESGLKAGAELAPRSVPVGRYRHAGGDPDPDAEIEQLLAEVRAELDGGRSEKAPPDSSS